MITESLYLAVKPAVYLPALINCSGKSFAVLPFESEEENSFDHWRSKSMSSAATF
jgi:hypothetical protein